MKKEFWALLTAAIAVEVTASVSLKAAFGSPALYALVIVGYGLSFYLLAKLLRAGAPIGVTYGIWSAAGIALTAICGTAFYDEPLTDTMIVGIVLVVAGVVLIDFGAHRAACKMPDVEA